MVMHVWRTNDNNHLSDFLVLLKGVYKRISQKKFGGEVSAEFVNIIRKFIEVCCHVVKLSSQIFLLKKIIII